MEAGGWGARASVAAAAAKKKKKKKEKSDAQPRHPVPFAQIPGITDAVREHLKALGATEPSFVIGKSLEMSDVNREQARLLFSCKRESPSWVTSAFTETEMQFVKDDENGLLITAFDRDNRSYNLTCKYLKSNDGYRFITGWKAYVEDNGLGVAMRVELWCFRSPKLPNRYELREGKKGREKVPVTVDIGHPDGSLGMVLLQYENDLLEPDEVPLVHETKIGHVESKTTTTIAVDKPEDGGGMCAKPIKSKTTIAEDKLVADGCGKCAESMNRNRNTVISREEMFNATIGLLKLKEHNGGLVVEAAREDEKQELQ